MCSFIYWKKTPKRVWFGNPLVFYAVWFIWNVISILEESIYLTIFLNCWIYDSASSLLYWFKTQSFIFLYGHALFTLTLTNFSNNYLCLYFFKNLLSPKHLQNFERNLLVLMNTLNTNLGLLWVLYHLYDIDMFL